MVGLIHGMGLGALFLLAFAGGLAGLYSLKPALITPEGVVERMRRLKVGVVAMAVTAWLTVITGTWIVYPWYREMTPDSPRSQPVLLRHGQAGQVGRGGQELEVLADGTRPRMRTRRPPWRRRSHSDRGDCRSCLHVCTSYCLVGAVGPAARRPTRSFRHTSELHDRPARMPL
jgi:hypothetical protein